ncbi:metalloregulator ArsR/SmtB family transcription factor [Streptomyces sp. NPDC048385]|uniref:ArsR/SmtB family transcription factor n=1 Tax=unclassified Streptomyces TaxID=2593676 RepID=UPI00342CDDDA
MIDSTPTEVRAVPPDATGASEQAASDASVALLQVVADPVRWSVLQQLAVRPSCVCNLQEHVPIPANLLSYHLKVLREAGLVTSSRRGRWIDYTLAADALERLHAALPGTAPAPAPGMRP